MPMETTGAIRPSMAMPTPEPAAPRDSTQRRWQPPSPSTRPQLAPRVATVSNSQMTSASGIKQPPTLTATMVSAACGARWASIRQSRRDQ